MPLLIWHIVAIGSRRFLNFINRFESILRNDKLDLADEFSLSSHSILLCPEYKFRKISFHIPSLKGFRYFITFIDDYSCLRPYFLRSLKAKPTVNSKTILLLFVTKSRRLIFRKLFAPIISVNLSRRAIDFANGKCHQLTARILNFKILRIS